MRKIILDFKMAENPEQVQDCLAREFGFPDTYGKNLDALYDMLTELGEDTCVGISEPVQGQGGSGCSCCDYLYRVKQVFWDAAEENPHLCVISGSPEENFEEKEL